MRETNLLSGDGKHGEETYMPKSSPYFSFKGTRYAKPTNPHLASAVGYGHVTLILRRDPAVVYKNKLAMMMKVCKEHICILRIAVKKWDPFGA